MARGGEPNHNLIIHFKRICYTIKDVISGRYSHRDLMKDVWEHVLKGLSTKINVYLAVDVPIPGSVDLMTLQDEDCMKIMFDNYSRTENIHVALRVSEDNPLTVYALPPPRRLKADTNNLWVPQPLESRLKGYSNKPWIPQPLDEEGALVKRGHEGYGSELSGRYTITIDELIWGSCTRRGCRIHADRNTDWWSRVNPWADLLEPESEELRHQEEEQLQEEAEPEPEDQPEPQPEEKEASEEDDHAWAMF